VEVKVRQVIAIYFYTSQDHLVAERAVNAVL
jgi:hypothetical protein